MTDRVGEAPQRETCLHQHCVKLVGGFRCNKCGEQWAMREPIQPVGEAPPQRVPDDPGQYKPIIEAIRRVAIAFDEPMHPGDYTKAKAILYAEIREWGRLLSLVPPPPATQPEETAPPSKDILAAAEALLIAWDENEGAVTGRQCYQRLHDLVKQHRDDFQPVPGFAMPPAEVLRQIRSAGALRKTMTDAPPLEVRHALVRLAGGNYLERKASVADFSAVSGWVAELSSVPAAPPQPSPEPSEESAKIEAIRVQMSKGLYMMPSDELPYWSAANELYHRVVRPWLGSGPSPAAPPQEAPNETA